MKFLRTVISVGAIAAAIISVAPGAVRAELAPNGYFVHSATSPILDLVGSQSASDFQVVIPRSGDSCAAASLPRLKVAGASVNPGSKKMIAPNANAAGPIKPVTGPDGLMWLCRHDDEAQQCTCIPWAQD